MAASVEADKAVEAGVRTIIAATRASRVSPGGKHRLGKQNWPSQKKQQNWRPFRVLVGCQRGRLRLRAASSRAYARASLF